MFKKLILSLFAILILLYQIDAACYIYPCEDYQSEAKCVNSTGKWLNFISLKYLS